MHLDRRSFVTAFSCTLVWPALAQEGAPGLVAYERASGGRVGFHAKNLATGAAVGWRADERFVMCSTFKASLAACVLSRVDRGEDRLDRMIRYGEGDLEPYAPVARAHLAKGELSILDMCRAAVEISDNTCANKLLAHLGGPATLTAFWRDTGDAISRLDHNEPLLNRSPPGDLHDTTTPTAMAGTLRRFAIGDTLAPASRERLVGWMVACQTGKDRLRRGLPGSWRIGDKTGNNGKDAFGDLAVAWPTPTTAIVIAAYTQGGDPTPAQVSDVFAEIGRIVTHRLA